jgi:hypothetical protein
MIVVAPLYNLPRKFDKIVAVELELILRFGEYFIISCMILICFLSPNRSFLEWNIYDCSSLITIIHRPLDPPFAMHNKQPCSMDDYVYSGISS